jgi:hypothetical protein
MWKISLLLAFIKNDVVLKLDVVSWITGRFASKAKRKMLLP